MTEADEPAEETPILRQSFPGGNQAFADELADEEVVPQI